MKIFFGGDVAKPVDILRLNPDKFMVAQFGYLFFAKRINNIGLVKTVGHCREGFFFHQVKAQKFIQLAEAFVIPGNSRVQATVAIAEIDSGNRLNPLFLGLFHKIDHTGGVVDIGHNNHGKVVFYRLLQQRFGFHGSVTQAVPGVT